jgi:tetratricopeptide (TPR) repeat protein
MSHAPGYQANLQRGRLLRQNGRPADACVYFRQAIESDPDRSEAYLELAMALGETPRNKGEWRPVIDRALSLEPDSPEILGSKAYLLASHGQYDDSKDFALRALQLDPHCHIALLAEANAHTKTAQWEHAEDSARIMLELDAHDTAALNLLAQALRFRGRHRESRQVIAQILAETPNDAFAQSNAGYEALNSDRHWQARQHFLNALRVDPDSDFARRGLLRALRERAWIYRAQLRALLYFSERWETSTALRFVAITLSVCTFGLFVGIFIIYTFTALCFHPFANFLLLFNSTARRAFTPRERRNAMLMGAAVAGGLLALALGGQNDFYRLVAGYFGISALLTFISNGIDSW